MAKAIFLPIDLNSSDQDRGTLAAALPMLDEGGVLHVATVVPNYGLPMVSVHFDRDYMKTAHNAVSDALTEWVAQHVPEGIDTRRYILTGSVYDEIINTANKVDADLIVIGAHRPELSDYLLGPNAARVVRHARQSVYVVRRPGKR